MTKGTYGAVANDSENKSGQELLNQDWKMSIIGAYSSNDQERSRLIHDMKRGQAGERHLNGGDHIKSAVYGGLDGIITTFATVTTVAGSGLSSGVILILGLAHLFADGLSMGLGDSLSTQAENELYRHEREREVWELENYPEGEIEEMVEIYESKGISKEDANLVVTTLAKYKEAFVDIMMIEELNLMPVDEDESPFMGGLVTFVSFMLFGSIPLVPYLLGLIPGLRHHEDTMLSFSCLMTVITLFILGAVKGKFVGQSWTRSGAIMAFNGTAAAGSGYLIGYLLKSLGIDDAP